MEVSLDSQYDWDSIYGRYGDITQAYAVKMLYVWIMHGLVFGLLLSLQMLCGFTLF